MLGPDLRFRQSLMRQAIPQSDKRPGHQHLAVTRKSCTNCDPIVTVLIRERAVADCCHFTEVNCITCKTSSIMGSRQNFDPYIDMSGQHIRRDGEDAPYVVGVHSIPVRGSAPQCFRHRVVNCRNPAREFHQDRFETVWLCQKADMFFLDLGSRMATGGNDHSDPCTVAGDQPH